MTKEDKNADPGERKLWAGPGDPPQDGGGEPLICLYPRHRPAVPARFTAGQVDTRLPFLKGHRLRETSRNSHCASTFKAKFLLSLRALNRGRVWWEATVGGAEGLAVKLG